jgi:hypothetical protein
MNTRNGALAVLAAAAAFGVPAATTADAATTTVKVRIEGKSRTLFEGPVTPSIQTVDGHDGKGPQKCDGTNGGANPTPGPTATSIMDTAVRGSGRSWQGNFDPSFGDFLVNRIGPDAATSKAFWGVAVDGKSLEVGGCQAIVKPGQEVLWAFDLFGKKLLHASGPSHARVGKVVKVKVVDTEKDAAVAGARIGGAKTDSSGIAKLRFTRRGVKRLKATAPKSIRSNALVVKVS